jgi:RNA polymerase sigma-70 factor (ECF subfamily)
MRTIEHYSPVETSSPITELLVRIKSRDSEAEQLLVPRIYPVLRKLAGRFLRDERPGHTLQPTALVNEVYLKVIAGKNVDWQDRSHFFAVASRVMRRILVDYARERKAAKRGGGQGTLELDKIFDLGVEQSELVLDLHECLDRLARLDARQAQIVEMRFFGGMTEEEIGMVLGVSARTVKREWVMARAWLHAELRPEG